MTNAGEEVRQVEVKSLGAAISEVEAAQTKLASADGEQLAKQAKFDEALLAKTAADEADAEAVAKFNDSLQTLIDAATAAKVVRGAAA